ncbi:MAG: alpha/beta hydrolase [Deltaproteobacteria bacterium]|nr:alpha/beta hydrolase [Deltaproteobacteria bacterium]MCL5791509.1 alpha/beta hydrolase [Deltaproteobacteria bacterium]
MTIADYIKRILILSFACVLLTACSNNKHGLSYTPTTVYFNPSGADFYSMPFPNDYETDAEGHPLLTGFPNPLKIPLLNQYLETARTEVVGFGTNAPMYMRFTGSSISLSTLPQTPKDSLSKNASMFLVNIDPSSSQYGSRVPLIWSYEITDTDYVSSNTLEVSPMYGFPLFGATKYALILTTQVKDINNHSIVMPQLMSEALLSKTGNDPALSRLINVYKPLYNYLIRDKINPDSIGAATVFTTQDPTKDLRTIRQFVSNLTGLGISTMGYYPEWQAWTGTNINVFGGTYTSPNFQYGTPPYAVTGGDFSFDTNGTPIIQRWESLDFSLTVPPGPQPKNGWPIALYAHGTGGSHMSVIEETGGVGLMLASRGIACIGIDQPLHGNRVNPPLSLSDLDLYSFNFFNPDEGRTNFRQSAVDSFVLTRLIKTGGLYITSGISPTKSPITFDTNNIIFIGHSQGGITGTLYAALEPDVKGAVLSGDGGDLSLTIIYRKDPIDIQQAVEMLFGILITQAITTFHPIVGLAQMLVEVTDPINYGHYLFNPYANGTPKDVVLTEGLLDVYAPPITAEALAVASGIPLIAPVAEPVTGLSIIGLSVFTPPVYDNITASNLEKVTAGLLQFPYDDHFAIFTDTTAQYKYSGFLQSLVYTGTAIIP